MSPSPLKELPGRIRIAESRLIYRRRQTHLHALQLQASVRQRLSPRRWLLPAAGVLLGLALVPGRRRGGRQEAPQEPTASASTARPLLAGLLPLLLSSLLPLLQKPSRSGSGGPAVPSLLALLVGLLEQQLAKRAPRKGD